MFADGEGALDRALISSTIKGFYRAMGVNLANAVIAALCHVVRWAMCKIAIILVILNNVSAALHYGEIDAAKEILGARIRRSRSRLAGEDNYEDANRANACRSSVRAALINQIRRFLVDFVVNPFLDCQSFQGLEVSCLYRVHFDLVVRRLGYYTTATARERVRYGGRRRRCSGHEVSIASTLPAIRPGLAIPARDLSDAPGAVDGIRPSNDRPSCVRCNMGKATRYLRGMAMAIDYVRAARRQFTGRFNGRRIVPRVMGVRDRARRRSSARCRRILEYPLCFLKLTNGLMATIATHLTVLSNRPRDVGSIGDRRDNRTRNDHCDVPIKARGFAGRIVTFY